MSVEAVDESLAQIVELGGKVVQGKVPIAGMGWYATCEDTEGNRIGVFQVDSAAT